MFQDYFNKGGIEKVILDIKNYIGSDYNIDILSMVNKSSERIISLLDKDYKKLFIRSLKGLKKYKTFLKNNKNNYDIIHIHCYNAFGLIYAFFARKYFKKIILHAHSSDIDRDFLYIKHLINSIIKVLFRSNKYLYIAVSEECNAFCFNVNNCIVLPNGIDYSKYYFDNDERIKYRKKFNIKDKQIVIGHIGRFNEQKNHTFIIEIFNEINKIKNNYKLILIGEGVLKEKIGKKIKELKLDSKVIILNNRNDITKLINMFDIYLFPSIFEGFGITVVENEVNGKYVFISDKITNVVIISNRVEVISLNKNADYWAEIITNIKEKEFKLDNRLDINNYIDKLRKIYEEI